MWTKEKHEKAERSWRCLVSEHEGKVQILSPITDVDVSVLWRHWHMVEGQAKPQQAAEHTHFAGTFKLKTPQSYT